MPDSMLVLYFAVTLFVIAMLLSEALVAWRQPDPANGTALIAHRALERLRRLAAPAADTGYDDQAHMIHEFRALSGLTPGEAIVVTVPFTSK